MPDGATDLTLSIGLDSAALRRDMGTLADLSRGFGQTITRAFASAITGGRKFSDVLRSLFLSLSRQALSAALKPLGSALGGLFGNLFGSANGNVVSAGRIVPFAQGGIVGGASLFAMRGGLGLMGEAGPEAIMPLARGADGRLGVRGTSGQQVHVTMNIQTPDVAGFRASQSQIAAGMLRALQRGERNL